MNILISWMALTNDFTEGTKVNLTGPNYTFHKYHYNYAKHILLYTFKTQLKAEFLHNKLVTDFPEHKTELHSVNIEDISNLPLMKSKVESILLDYADDDIDIFFSPGASVMQLSWYICHTSLGLNTHLIQMLRPEHSKNKDKPDLVYIENSFSQLPRSAVLRQKSADKKYQKNEAFLISDSIKPIYDRAQKIAQTDSVSVLITGETGTGKEHLARFIHQESARHRKPFEAVNCAGFSDELLESRLFGYKKGAFTGAFADEDGIFKKASGGTVFLDEIGDISPYMQQSLLRVLQEKEIRPIGGNTIKIDVRIISATNKNVFDMVTQGKFRADLYYRLAVTDLHLPNLTERGYKDKQHLIEHFIINKQKQLKRPNALQLTQELADYLKQYKFPGNIRELENLIERFYVFCDNVADITDLPQYMQEQNVQDDFKLKTAEAKHIRKVYRHFEGNNKQTAKALGIALNTFKSKLDKYKIEKIKK